LSPPDLLQLLDHTGAFPIGFFEEPAETESQAAGPIIR
jgi:hypothetical protein